VITAVATMLTAIGGVWAVWRAGKIEKKVDVIHVLTNNALSEMKALLQLYRTEMQRRGVTIPPDPSIPGQGGGPAD